MAMLNLDAILDAASLPERGVKLCLNGKLRRKYETVRDAIAEREAEADAGELSDQLKAADAPADTRLGTKAPEKPAAVPADDPARVELAALLEQMKEHTVEFVVQGIPSQEWGELLEKHPPRKLADTGRLDPRDASDGVNTSTFYPELVKRALTEPEMTDAQYEKVMGVLTDAQFNRLAKAAGEVNVQDEDVPF
jgi:hypothetical protein